MKAIELMYTTVIITAPNRMNDPGCCTLDVINVPTRKTTKDETKMQNFNRIFKQIMDGWRPTPTGIKLNR
jgi:hypothetical protein